MSDISRIRVLPANVANKIAAGDVIERPASVLKELLENAIDSGATTIDVEIGVGGKKLVSVADNGRGMGRDDALLSIERHATSKIRDVDDVENIQTLGFRGEALAAISSVSRFKIISKRRGDTEGIEISVSGGKLYDVSDAGCPEGTKVEVRDLFFNVPARRKFLRTHQTEVAHIKEMFVTHALAHPDIAMTCKIDREEAFNLPADANGPEERIRELFGNDHFNKLCRVSYKAKGIEVSGFISMPERSRSDREDQFFFINGRCASAPVVYYCIRQAYSSLLPDGRHPSLFLFVQVPPGDVDVNVHPAKREVRFRRPPEVRDALISAMRNALGRDEKDTAPPVMEETSAPPPLEQTVTIEDLPELHVFNYPGMPMVSRDKAAPIDSTAGVTAEKDEAGRGDMPWKWCRILGQIGGLYVLLEMDDGFAMMDPHAAHERVMFEKFMKEMIEGGARSQALLSPETIELRPKDAQRVHKQEPLLKEMGFGISEFGADTFIIDAIPARLGEVSAKLLILDIVLVLEKAGTKASESIYRESIARTACKAAVKANDRLSLAEIEQIVVDLALCEMPYTCPHGRPTMIFNSYQEIARKFSRT